MDTSEALVSYYRLIMRCGVELRNARPKFQLVEDLAENFLMPLTVCRDCLNLGPIAVEKRHYLYGLVEAQSAHDAELEPEEAA
jgi:hypothetical protein